MSHGGALYERQRERIVKKGLDLAAKSSKSPPRRGILNGKYQVKGTDLSISFTQTRGGTRARSIRRVAPYADGIPGGRECLRGRESTGDRNHRHRRLRGGGRFRRAAEPHAVEGQLCTRLVQGIGQVLAEHCVYDASASSHGSFMDYAMPRSEMRPAASLRSLRALAEQPLGAKGAGEAGTTGAIPAAASGDRRAAPARHPSTSISRIRRRACGQRFHRRG